MASSQETLTATKRELSGTSNAKRLRRAGFVPGVLYGKTQDNYAIQIEAKEFETLLKGHESDNFLVSLEIEGAKEKKKLAMVQDIQSDPLSRQLIHVDFHAVNEDDNLTATLPIILNGEPEGVKSGGILEHTLREIEIQCRPADLPASFEYDISEMSIGDSIHVSDLNLGEGVSTDMDGTVIIAIVNESRAAVAAGGAAGEEGEEGAAEGAEAATEES